MMLVDTDAENSGAIRLFRKLGFGQDLPHLFLSLNLTTHPEYQKARNR
jgi:hypothetical protein